ncbi:Tyrosine recombinase XerC [subsurface metagenome]
MKTQSEIKIQKVRDYKYIVIYYKLKNCLIRINTKERYIEGKHQKDLYYNSKMENHQTLNRRIRDLKMKIDAYIALELYKIVPQIDQKDCLRFIEEDYYKDNFGRTEQIDNKTVLEHFTEFYSEKETELLNTASLKDYKSFENAIRDFETYYNKTLTLDGINSTEFLFKLRNFFTIRHPKNFKTRGNLNDNTIAKRISSFRSFMSYIEEKGIYSFNQKLYKAKTVKRYTPQNIALSKEDIELLINTKWKNKFHQKIIDVFVMNCFMGLRWSDIVTLEKGSFIQDEDGDWEYHKTNEKTDVDIIVPILPTALQILEKYDWKLPKYTNQYFNRALKDILVEYKLLEETVKKKRVKGGEITVDEYKRNELISTHTCRRTFITLAITHNVPLNAIQGASGHMELKTLQKYAKHIMDKEAFGKMDL